jgi:uncharacterized protein (DUF427 family)
MIIKARWNGITIAESEQCQVVEGNYYFPSDAVRQEYLRPSQTHTLCFWKGQASYYDLEVNGARNPDAAWYYPNPSPLARKIKGYIAFWNGIEIEREWS